MKLKWKVGAAPTGPYKSFYKREWPEAMYEDGSAAALITCDDDYRPARVKTGEHAVLAVSIASYPLVRDPKEAGFVWRKLTARFETLDLAKAAAQHFIDTHPDFRPPIYRD
jgi:hypothetical protein